MNETILNDYTRQLKRNYLHNGLDWTGCDVNILKIIIKILYIVNVFFRRLEYECVSMMKKCEIVPYCLQYLHRQTFKCRN